MAQFHFVEDYERMVADLIASHPIDEAMSLAVGGMYESIGPIEVSVLRRAGLREGSAVFDLGCGSGRLASALGRCGLEVSYLGTDVVQSLLDYAASKSPAHFQFRLHRELSIPLPDASTDIACAFSVFTHLLHHESYIYLEEMRRVVRPGGAVVFSFIEFTEPWHWPVFTGTVQSQRNSSNPVLNSFIERSVIEIWARHLGFDIERFLDASEDLGDGWLGQSSVVLRVA
jgi:ubiquinone/menaquinone biosynthesis C-methylase UbiE